VEDPIRRAFYQVFGIAVLGLLALVPSVTESTVGEGKY
jgi:hypothetical protein